MSVVRFVFVCRSVAGWPEASVRISLRCFLKGGGAMRLRSGRLQFS